MRPRPLQSARLLGLLAMALATAAAGGAEGPAPVAGYRVIEVYPHDPRAYTQGLVHHEGLLYESTGRDSDIREIRLDTGEVLRRKELDDRFFGEGLTLWRGRLIQLTWKARTGFVYDRETFRRERTFSYPGEGWGLTHDDRHLIVSDGSATLRFLDPQSFEARRRVRVHDGARSVDDLNELEYVRGEVYANVYRSDRIARIDPASGRVLGWIDLAGLADANEEADVLNGIAYDAAGDRLFVTGKLWPHVFEIEVLPE